MYDITEKIVELTADELAVAKIALERYQETTVSVGESITIECLLDKLN